MTRDQAFSILYNLIFRGFLVGEMEMGKSLFVFKTVTDREFNLIKVCSGNDTTNGYLERFNMNFLAHSVFAVDGVNVLADRTNNLPDLSRFFSGVPGHIFKYLMAELNNLRNESYESLKFMEGFCYTSESRRMWKSFGGLAPNSEAVTGIPGTSLIGSNVHQENWVYVNKALDDEAAYDREFSLSLFVASASNPKGAKHTRSQHDSHVKSMEEHRKKLAEVGYIDTENWSESGWASSVDTAEELVAELDRQMKGMKDRHDRFIENHLKKIKDEAERRTKEAEARIKASRTVLDGPDIMVSQRPLTAEETANMVYGKRPLMTTVYSEEHVSGQDAERILRKIGSRILTARR